MRRFTLSFIIVSLAALPIGLTGCGFTPLHMKPSRSDTRGAVSDSPSNTAIDIIADREGQMLRNRLMDRMWLHGPPRSPDQTLRVTLSFLIQDVGIRRDATTSRQRLLVTANYVLVDRDGNPKAQGEAQSIVSTNDLIAQYGTITATANARERAIRDIADQIVNRVALEAKYPDD